jgi:hypothetical protein
MGSATSSRRLPRISKQLGVRPLAEQALNGRACRETVVDGEDLANKLGFSISGPAGRPAIFDAYGRGKKHRA